MKVLTLTSTLIAALSVAALAQDNSTLLSKISVKEKQISEIQKEIAGLRSQLNRPSSGTYVVKTGDTVSSIARRHHVSASEIMTWNKITDPTKLGIGEKLIVSSNSSSVSVTSTRIEKPRTSAPITKGYTVAKGDTFYSIARRHSLSVKQLRALNPGVSTHLISVGQTVTVSGDAKPKALVQEETKKAQAIAKVTKKPTAAPVINKPVPKKSSTAITLAKKTTPPAYQKKAETVVKKKESVALLAPPTPPVVEAAKPIAPTSVAAIILTDETTFDDFASKHGTSTDQLNALNGWNLPKATLLARGSEIYVPK